MRNWAINFKISGLLIVGCANSIPHLLKLISPISELKLWIRKSENPPSLYFVNKWILRQKSKFGTRHHYYFSNLNFKGYHIEVRYYCFVWSPGTWHTMAGKTRTGHRTGMHWLFPEDWCAAVPAHLSGVVPPGLCDHCIGHSVPGPHIISLTPTLHPHTLTRYNCHGTNHPVSTLCCTLVSANMSPAPVTCRL